MKVVLQVLALALVLASGVARAGSEVAEENTLLANITRRAFDDPEPMLRELDRLQPGSLPAAREAAWLLARGRVLLQAGHSEAADAIAAQLMGSAEGINRGWLLRALIQERAGKQAGTLAARALAGLEKACPAGAEARAVTVLGCDFRAAWEALRLLQREHGGQGALVDAEASILRALALARAGDDKHLIALSHGMHASVLQAQDQLEAAQAEIRAGLAESRNDPVASARVRNYQANVERRSGDLPGARVALEAALALADQADAPHLAAQLRANLVDAYMHLGQLQQALATGQRALPVLQRFHDRLYERALHHNLAIARIKLRQFDAARQELAKAAALGYDPADLVPRARELRELADTWGDAGQYKEALAAYHEERALNARSNERNSASALEGLRRKYDSAARQRDLDLLARDGQLKDQQLENRRLAQQVGIAVGALLLLSTALIGMILLRMRRAQARLTANQRRLRHQSQRDPLTDLSNRRHFLALMDRRARTDGDSGFHGGLMMVDIDHFKAVNDEHSHAAGDAVLVEVARRLRAAVRDEDVVVRWGGEEFLVFASQTDAAQLAQMAERILRSIGTQTMNTPDGALRITASIGFASFPLGGGAGPGLRLHWEQAVNWADMVLYKAKAEGRNRAIGIAAVEAPDADTLAVILQDFDTACLNGQVHLTVLPGPAA